MEAYIQIEKLLKHNKRKFFIIRFVSTIKSIILIAKELLNRNIDSFNFILIYTFFQDHIELLLFCDCTTKRNTGNLINSIDKISFLDNVLFYITGFLVCGITSSISCYNWERSLERPGNEHKFYVLIIPIVYHQSHLYKRNN